MNISMSNMMRLLATLVLAMLHFFSEAQVTNALNFDNVDDRVSFSKDISEIQTNVNGLFTVEAWIKPSVIANSNDIVTFGHTSNQQVFEFRVEAGKLQAGYWNGSAWQYIESSTSIVVGEWVHVAVTRSTNTIKLFINGVENASKTDLTNAITINRMAIGMLFRNNSFDLNYAFAGTIDEVRIWKKALTASELTANLTNHLAGSEADLYAYYRFNQGTAGGSNTSVTTLTNSSSVTGLDGALENFARTGSVSNWVSGRPFGISFSYPSSSYDYVAGTAISPVTVNSAGGSPTALQVSSLSGSQDFNAPSCVIHDGNGNLYVADGGLHRISKVVLSTGVVTTLAGSTSGFANGIGVAAKFNTPVGMVLDGSGNLFVADQNNSLIRKIVIATGEVSTFAGSTIGNVDGTGSAAKFSGPRHMVWDGGSFLYLTDKSGQRIRKIHITTAAVTTIVGGVKGFADSPLTPKFRDPDGIALDGNGNLYVADPGNYKIRKVVSTTGVTSTFAGSGGLGTLDGSALTATFKMPAGMAYDASSDNLYVVDSWGPNIRKILVSTGAVTTLSGGITGTADGQLTAAKFDYPFSIHLDASGNIYVTDQRSTKLRVISNYRIDPALPGGLYFNPLTGAISGTPTTPTAQRSYTVYASNSINSSSVSLLISVSAAPTVITSSASGVGTTTATLSAAVTANGGNTTAMEMQYSKVLANVGSDMTAPIGGLVTGFANAGVNRNLTGLEPATTYYYRAMASNAAGTSYGSIKAFSTKILAPSVSYTPGTRTYSIGTTITPEQVTNSGGLPENSIVTTFSGTSMGYADGNSLTAKFDGPRDIEWDGGDNLYMVDLNNHRIRKIVISTGMVSTIAGGTAGNADGIGALGQFNAPAGITYDPSGNLYVADAGNERIRRIELATGMVSTLAGSTFGATDGTGASASFAKPSGIAYDGIGNLYVTDFSTHRIRKIVVATGVVTTFAGGYFNTGYLDGSLSSARFNKPLGIAADGSGFLYVADHGNHRIRKIDVAAGTVSTLPLVSQSGTEFILRNPSAVFANGSGFLYVSDYATSRISLINLATGVTSTLAGSGSLGNLNGVGIQAKFNNPMGIASDGNGTLYVADHWTHSIRQLSRFSLQPALPVGLSFNPASGEITGTPTAISPLKSYNLSAANAGGTHIASVLIEVTSSLLTADVTAIRETTATTGGTVGASYTGITERGVVWNTVASPTTFHFKLADASATTGSFISNITGLTRNTTYYVRSYVTHSGGTAYGNQKSFKTNALGTFTDITKTFGDAKFSLGAPTAVSWGAFSFASSNTSVATVSGSQVTIVGVGTTTITATQAAVGAYASASTTLALTVSPATPAIILNIPNTTTLAAASNMSITATSSNGAPVMIAIGSGTATGTLTLVSAGSYTLGGVSSTGDLVFNATTSATATHAAGSKTVTMDVTKNNQTITFGSPTAVTYSTGLTQTLTATSSSSLTVSLTVVSGPGNITGTNTLNITGPGNILIRASQTGNGSFNPAPEVDRTLVVNPGAPVVTSFTPSSATEDDVVTITGQYFDNVSTVSFGGTSATSFTVVNSTTITAVLGTGHSGAVSVTTTGGTDTEPGFRYKVTWTGATNAYNTASNWTGSRAPQTDDDIIFSPAAASDLELDGSKTVGNVHFNGSGRALKLGAHNLTIKGNLSMPGNISGTGRVIMNGSGAQTITGGGDIPDLEIDNATGVTIDASGAELTVSGTLRSTAGTLTTNGKLRLSSNSSGTARVGAVTGGFNGNVIAERYVPQNQNSDGTGRAWRLVSLPVTGTGTLRHFFMNGRPGLDLTLTASRDGETDNSGTPIVGHNYATASEATTAGFDWIGVANQVSSLRSYVGDAGGGSFGSENVPTMTTTYAAANQGYMVFTRGDRKLDFPSATTSSATTFHSTGALKTGNQTVSVAPASTSKFTLVGNPYMSVLDLDAFYTTNSAVINSSFWIWDANISGTNKQGGYVNVYKSGTQWVTNTGNYINPELLESGMAFFVEPVSSLSIATNISIMELHKSGESAAGLSPFSNDKPDDHGRMYVRLERADAQGKRNLIDGVMADFHTSHKESLTDQTDREKLRNGISRGALWIPREQKSLSGEGLPWPKDVKRSIPLTMSGVGDQTLIVHIDPRGMRDRYVKAWLKDNVLKREVEINMSQPTDYDFIGTGRADWDSTRFEIVYVEAGRQGTGVTLEPDDAAEQPSVKLYPNPSKSTDVKLSLRAVVPGIYTVQVLDMTGRLIATSTLEHRSVNGEYRVLQGRHLSSGQYVVRLISADKQFKETLRMVLE